MKSFILLFLAFFLLSCQNDSPAPKQPTSAIIPDTKIPGRQSANPYMPVDLSPIDLAYLPADYPLRKMNGEAKTPPVARVIYSRPQRQGRQIFGNIVKWGEPWRLGANEATEIQLFQPVTIQNKRMESGTYILYALPYENHWTIVFNSNLYTWGLKFNLANDVAKFDVPAVKKPQEVEYFSLVFEKTGTGADLVMAWEDREARLPIQY